MHQLSIGCSDGIVNLYNSLYQNVISKEVEEQAISKLSWS